MQEVLCLCCAGSAAYTSVDTVLGNTRQLLSVMVKVQTVTQDVEKGIKDAGLDKIQAFVGEVRGVLDKLAPAISPLKVVGDIMSGINEALQFLK